MDKKSIVLVTGGAMGIGAAACVRLAEDGLYNIVIGDRAEEEGEKTAALCREKGAQADFMYADMGVEADVEALVKFVADKYGRIDFYFNNQGDIHMPADLQDLTEADMDLVVHSNLKACFFGVKHVGRLMIKQKSGHILNTGSSAGIRPEAGFGVYSASKHAVVGLSKLAAIEYARYNVKVNCLCPGGYVTPLTERVGKYMQEKAYVPAKMSLALLGPAHMGEVSEIVGIISCLANDANVTYMTGSVISADGGNTL
jgi:NAD(P)-dependent dehydrogenase (short-subunit alcohol dehydrogenase family)